MAHGVSVMVIQASAGDGGWRQRIPALAAEAFDSIGEAARQAEAEISPLVQLRRGRPAPIRAARTACKLIDELVARARGYRPGR